MWVSHYTTIEAAAIIFSNPLRVIRPYCKWENQVYVMLEPSISSQANRAGAKDAEVKIMFKAFPHELEIDPGKEKDVELRALRFRATSSISLHGRAAFIMPVYPHQEEPIIDFVRIYRAVMEYFFK